MASRDLAVLGSDLACEMDRIREVKYDVDFLALHADFVYQNEAFQQGIWFEHWASGMLLL